MPAAAGHVERGPTVIRHKIDLNVRAPKEPADDVNTPLVIYCREMKGSSAVGFATCVDDPGGSVTEDIDETRQSISRRNVKGVHIDYILTQYIGIAPFEDGLGDRRRFKKKG